MTEQEKLKKLRAKHSKLLANLRKIEWGDHNDFGMRKCPACGGARMYHNEGCWIKESIGENL